MNFVFLLLFSNELTFSSTNIHALIATQIDAKMADNKTKLSTKFNNKCGESYF